MMGYGLKSSGIDSNILMCFGIDPDGLNFVCNKKIMASNKITVIKPLMFCLMNKKTLKTQILIRTDSYSTMLEIHAIKKV